MHYKFLFRKVVSFSREREVPITTVTVTHMNELQTYSSQRYVIICLKVILSLVLEDYVSWDTSCDMTFISLAGQPPLPLAK